MSWIPTFQIGLYNAWIFMVLFLVASMALLFIDNEKSAKRGEGEPTWSELSRTSKIVLVITHFVIMPFTIVYSIFLPLKLGTWWFYAGLPILLLALAMGVLFSISFAMAPLDEPITSGIFAISRHPGYLGFFLTCIGIGIACASWVFLLCALVWMVAWHFGVAEEERVMVEKYGDAYRAYMDRTPRWIGFPKRS
ncbi:MAG: isoprenylcysteine carboxylmethyltransferase family protein [Anaerolineales bacterium]|jgi:protein-S-isoprenylcysteine O-methyltransferase Ste14